ncbi:MAG: helix-turn-helix domain-containing protein [Sedimenticola sp.]
MKTKLPSSSKVAYSIEEVAEAVGVCRQTVFNEINSRRLRSAKIGRRRVISSTALHEWLAKLERAAL